MYVGKLEYNTKILHNFFKFINKKFQTKNKTKDTNPMKHTCIHRNQQQDKQTHTNQTNEHAIIRHSNKLNTHAYKQHKQKNKNIF